MGLLVNNTNIIFQWAKYTPNGAGWFDITYPITLTTAFIYMGQEWKNTGGTYSVSTDKTDNSANTSTASLATVFTSSKVTLYTSTSGRQKLIFVIGY